VILHRLQVWLSKPIFFVHGHPSLQQRVASKYFIAILCDVCCILDTEKGMQIFANESLWMTVFSTPEDLKRYDLLAFHFSPLVWDS
jgi:hypothetical protein